MPEENVADANATTGGNPDVSVSSIDDGFRNIDPSVDNVPTVDVIPAKEEVGKAADDGAGKESAIAAEVKDGEAPKETGVKGQEGRFDKDPDWQRMIKERDDARIEAAAAKAKLEVLTPKVAAEVKPDVPTYKDITKLSKEELIEWQEDDPIGYAANLYSQMKAEWKIEQEIETRKAAEESHKVTVKGTYDKYEKDNPDFRTKWDSGELQKFMDENPGHNAISAHMILTENARIEAAVAKAVKEKEAEVIKNFQAKRNAQVISDGGSIKSGDRIADELKNPQKYGGVTSALALRLQRMRQAVAG